MGVETLPCNNKGNGDSCGLNDGYPGGDTACGPGKGIVAADGLTFTADGEAA